MKQLYPTIVCFSFTLRVGLCGVCRACDIWRVLRDNPDYSHCLHTHLKSYCLQRSRYSYTIAKCHAVRVSRHSSFSPRSTRKNTQACVSSALYVTIAPRDTWRVSRDDPDYWHCKSTRLDTFAYQYITLARNFPRYVHCLRVAGNFSDNAFIL